MLAHLARWQQPRRKISAPLRVRFIAASGTLAVTEAQDVAVFTGTVIGLPVGILATTELPDNVIILADYQPPPTVVTALTLSKPL